MNENNLYECLNENVNPLSYFPLFIQIGQFIWKLNSVSLEKGQLGIEVVV